MRKYFLVAEKKYNGNFNVFVTDNSRGCTVLMEIEADSFSEAVKRVSFTAHNMGKGVFCGVDANGNPFHGEGNV